MKKQKLLALLSPYNNSKVLVKKTQSTKNIVDGVLENHVAWESEYDKICGLFDAETSHSIAQKIFQFIKFNIPYKEESEKEQTLRSPAALLAMPNADCKGYSNFIAGIIDALNRQGAEIPFSYRFASYGAENVTHVFVVLYPDTKDEIWVDACLNYLDERKITYFYEDYKFKPMSIYKVSGVRAPKIAGDENDEGFTIDSEVLGFFQNLFSSIFGGGKETHYQGWQPHEAYGWTITDGDDVGSEARNVMNYIREHGVGVVVQAGGVTQKDYVIALIAKLRRAGMNEQADKLQQQFNNYFSSGSGGSGGSSGSEQQGVSDERNNTFLYIGAGALLYFLLKK